MDSIVNKLNSELLISDAFIWEGSAKHYFNKKEIYVTEI